MTVNLIVKLINIWVFEFLKLGLIFVVMINSFLSERVISALFDLWFGLVIEGINIDLVLVLFKLLFISFKVACWSNELFLPTHGFHHCHLVLHVLYIQLIIINVLFGAILNSIV